MIRWRPATEEDIREVVKRAKEVFSDNADLVECCQGSLRAGEAAALFDDDGRIGCVIGMVVYWSGVASVWSITTAALAAHPLGYTRAVRDLLEGQIKKLGLHRVEMAVKADYGPGHSWARALGFEYEGPLKKYGSDGSDYKMFRRLS